MEIVEWCNNNEGFLTMLLSLFTLITSIIAIIVSIKTAQLPYKKKIDINTFYNEIEGNKYSCRLFIINTGNRVIGISSIYLEYGDSLIYTSESPNKYIKPSEVEEIFFTFNQDRVNQTDEKAKITILDTEREEHIFEEYIQKYKYYYF